MTRRQLQFASLMTMGLALSPGLHAQTIEEIVVTGVRGENDPTQIAPDAAALLATPGDINDPLKALLSLPGITFAGGDMEEPIIRGAGPRDNLFLVDNIPVDYVFHELSDSIISPNVIRTFDLYAGAMPAGYSDATGGVIDIGLRDPGDERDIRIDLSQLKSGFLIETPLGENASGYLSYRHNLAHLFLTEFEEADGPLIYQMPESRDYTGKMTWNRGASQIDLTVLGAWDKTEDKLNENAGPGFVGETIERAFNAVGLGLTRSVGQGEFQATLSLGRSTQDYTYTSGHYSKDETQTWALRSHYTRSFGRHDVTLGANYTLENMDINYLGERVYCNYMEVQCAVLNTTTPVKLSDDFKTFELYVSDTIALTDRFSATLGLHGEQDSYLSQSFVEPRLSLNYQLSERIETYVQAGRYHQRPENAQLLLMGANGPKQEAERSTHFILGQRWNLSDTWRIQTDLYWKDFELKDLVGTGLADKVSGQASGVDVLVVRGVEQGLSGWLALSYGKSDRKIASTGRSFDYRYAPPFSATLALNYTFENGWRIGTKYRTQSGDQYTPILGVDVVDGYPRGRYGPYHSARTDNYRRLDIRVEKQSSYSFADVQYYVDVLNVLDTQNVSNRFYPDYLFRPNGQGGYTPTPDEDAGIPRFIAFGVNLKF